jgi:hypothetical protein
MREQLLGGGQVTQLLDDIKRSDLSPLGLQALAMMLLSHIAKRAEAASDPVGGASAIDFIATAAKQYYRRASE